MEGPSEIVVVGNGNPLSLDPFNSDQRKLFYGKAMLIIQTQRDIEGEIKISVESSGIERTNVICKRVK